MSFWFVLRAEYAKFRGTFKRYYLDSIGEFISYTFLIIGLFLTIFQNVEWAHQLLFQLLTGIFIWYIAINAVANFGHILQDEMAIGTLEQIYLTRTSMIQMLFGRAVGSFVFHALGGFILLVVCVFCLIMFTSLSWRDFQIVSISWVSFFLLMVLIMLGIYGFSFLLAGFSLVLKRIGVFTILFDYIFLFFTGITLSSKQIPVVIDWLSKCLPITWGIHNLKHVILKNMGLGHLIQQTDFYWLCLNTAVYLFFGLFIFTKLEKRARENGDLGRY